MSVKDETMSSTSIFSNAKIVECVPNFSEGRSKEVTLPVALGVRNIKFSLHDIELVTDAIIRCLGYARPKRNTS